MVEESLSCKKDSNERKIFMHRFTQLSRKSSSSLPLYQLPHLLCSVILLCITIFGLSGCKYGTDIPVNDQKTQDFIDKNAIPNLPSYATISGNVNFGSFWDNMNATVSGMFDATHISIIYHVSNHSITETTSFSGTTLQLDSGPVKAIYSASANSPSHSPLASIFLLGRSALPKMATTRFDPFNYSYMKGAELSTETSGEVSLYHLKGYVPLDFDLKVGKDDTDAVQEEIWMTQDTYFPTKITISNPGESGLSLNISHGGTSAAGDSKNPSSSMLGEINKSALHRQSWQQQTIPPCQKPDDIKNYPTIKIHFSNTCADPDIQESTEIINIVLQMLHLSLTLLMFTLCGLRT
jgi:hypothetical protein